MPDASLVVAVDIGSTRTHIGLVDPGRRTCLHRIDFTSSEYARQLPASLDALRKFAGRGSFSSVHVAGARNNHAGKIMEILTPVTENAIVSVRYHARLPVAFRYKNPSMLGADRIADALAAHVLHPQRDVIIVDSGTAVTVNLKTKSGEFAGGVIMAGIETQLQSLHASTSTLPLLDMKDRFVAFPGDSTETGMLAGAVYGGAGGLNLIVRTYQSMLDGNALILAAGGGWRVTEKLVDFDFTAVPDLTLIGTALYIE